MVRNNLVLGVAIVIALVVGLVIGIFIGPQIFFAMHGGHIPGGAGGSFGGNYTQAAAKDNLTGTLNLTGKGVGSYTVDLYVYNPPVWNFSVSNIIALPGDIITINFRNTGDEDHTFTINNPNGSGYLVDTGYVAPGTNKSVTFTVPSAPGTYTYYCRVPGHKEDGMVGTLEIE
jgi:plastocyanin